MAESRRSDPQSDSTVARPPQPDTPEQTLDTRHDRPDKPPTPQPATLMEDPRSRMEPTGGLASVQVPGYEMLGELGRGGMGVVYKARHVKLNRIVALKMILRAAYASVQERLRFQIEAEAVARLQHPNIVQLHEVGEHDGLPFFSLEFCEGGALDTQLQERKQTPCESAELVETLARAMHYAASARRGPSGPEAGQRASVV